MFTLGGDGPGRTQLFWIFLASLFSAALPIACLLFLRAGGKVSDFSLPNRLERTRPLLAGLTCYGLGTLVLFAAGGPKQVVVLMGCHAVAAGMAALVNLRWKISLHAVGACSGLVALYYCMGQRTLWLSPVVTAIAWARLRMGAHTPSEILAGAGLGALATFSVMELLT